MQLETLTHSEPLPEPWIGQGPSLQPHAGALHLEKAQHPQPAPIPLIFSSVFFTVLYLHVSYIMMVSYTFKPKCNHDSQKF
jgi:hypothetical protein